MAKGKELVKYNPYKAGYQKVKMNVKNIAKRIRVVTASAMLPMPSGWA